jgi:pimeloyl-ACP methyl ester carboxylesterase
MSHENGRHTENGNAIDIPVSGDLRHYTIANVQYRLPSGELLSYFDSAGQNGAAKQIRQLDGKQDSQQDDKQGKLQEDAQGSQGSQGSKHDGKPVLVLLHGYCGSSAYWEKVTESLAQVTRVIAPDARGHGASSAPAADVYEMESFADDLEALLSHLGVQSAILLGHSLGGYITLSYAERYPSRLAGFGLVHSTPRPDSEAARQNRDKAADALRKDGIKPFVDGLIPKLFAADHLDSLAEEIQRCKDIGLATDSRAAAATALGMKARPDRSETISGASVPVLLLAGLKDGVVPPESTFSAGGDHVVRAEIAEAGHMSMMERPDYFVAEVKAFLSSGWGE